MATGGIQIQHLLKLNNESIVGDGLVLEFKYNTC